MKLPSAILIALAGICVAVPPGATTSVTAFLDVNGDGTISESERQAYEESRANARGGGTASKVWDKNGDDQVDDAERDAAVAELQRRMDAKVASVFLDLAGEDALLSLAEFSSLPKFANTPPEVPAKLFNALDVDANGSVTIVEFFKGTGRGNPPAGAAAKRKGPK